MQTYAQQFAINLVVSEHPHPSPLPSRERGLDPTPEYTVLREPARWLELWREKGDENGQCRDSSWGVGRDGLGCEGGDGRFANRLNRGVTAMKGPQMGSTAGVVRR